MRLLMQAINKNHSERRQKIPVISVEKPSHDRIKKGGHRKLFNIDCGSYVSKRIIGGSAVERGQWPFVVALLVKTSKQFFCGGTLITSKHVLTAAHCIQDKNVDKKLEAEQIEVLLGRHSLKDNSEKGSQTRDVEKIIVHPEWKFNIRKYDADLAILVLDHAVAFSNFIQPACLTDDPELDNENRGVVVGNFTVFDRRPFPNHFI